MSFKSAPAAVTITPVEMVWTAGTASVAGLPSTSAQRRQLPQDLVSTSTRLLVRWFQLSGQMAGDGCGWAVYQLLLMLAFVGSYLATAAGKFARGMVLWYTSGEIFSALFNSEFFGAPLAITSVLAITIYSFSRRPYACLYKEVLQFLAQMRGGTDKISASVRRLAIEIISGMILCTIAVCLIVLWNSPVFSVCQEMPWLSCFISVLFSLFTVVCVSFFMLLPFKFLFITRLLSIGMRNVSGGITSRGKCVEDSDYVLLCELRNYQLALSGFYRRLTDCISTELKLTMTLGIINAIVSMLSLVSSVQNGSLSSNVSGILYCLCITIGVTVAPCLIGQYMLNVVGEMRDVLLELRCESPRTCHELSMLLEGSRRDLDTFGSLTVYRLESPTLLSALTACITYIIVFVQFQSSEIACRDVNVQLPGTDSLSAFILNNTKT